jgi:aryl-alcohol dehydrogenase-like predicted oxidoreductase
MRFKRFGKTGMNMSVITVGTWGIGGSGWGKVERKASIDAIRAMVDEGVNSIDTAAVYGGGHSEEVVGEAVKGIRSKLYIITKVTLPMGVTTIGDVKTFVTKECELSLKRLGTDYIDLYLVHWPFKAFPAEDTMATLNLLKKQGKIRNIGVSNFDEAQIKEFEKYGQISALQSPFSMVNQKYEKLMRFAKSHDMGVMTYGSLGAGILSGAIRTLPSFDAGDARLFFYDFFEEPKFSSVMELLKTLDEIAKRHNVPVVQVAINWSTQNPVVDTAILGVSNPRHAKENCAAMSWELTAAEIAEIKKAYAKTVGKMPLRELKIT